MPKRPPFRAGDPGCQAELDERQREYEAGLAKRIIFICQDCGEMFTETLRTIAEMKGDEIMAPALCRACGHGAEDE